MALTHSHSPRDAAGSCHPPAFSTLLVSSSLHWCVVRGAAPPSVAPFIPPFPHHHHRTHSAAATATMTASVSLPPSSQPLEPKRVALVLTVFLSDLLLTGLVFGWAPLLLMLQEEQQYVELCDFDSDDYLNNVDADGNDNGPLTCVAQENRLNLMFAVASVTMNAGALPIGFFLDYAGPKIAVMVAAVVEVSGLLLLAFADSQEFDVFLPAYTLLALGGSMTMMSSFPASFLMMQHQTAILAAISCLFDGSSVVFLVLYSIKESFDASRQQLLIAFAGVAGAIYVALIALWHVNEHALSEDESESTRDSSSNTELESLLAPEAATAGPESEHYPSNDIALTPIVISTSSNSAPLSSSNLQYGSVALETQRLQLQQRIQDEFELVDVAMDKQMATFEFVYIVVFAAVQVLRATIYIGTTNKLLENYGDRQHEYLFTKIFSFVLPMGFLFVPAIDHIVEKKGLALSLLFTNVLGVMYNLMAFVPSLQVQCLTFFVFAGYRAFLYAVMSAFTAKTFGLKNMGSLMGIIFSIGSVVSLAEYPAVYLSNAYFDGDLTVLYGFSLLLCLLLFPYTEYLRKHEREREDKKQRLLAKLGGGYAASSNVPATPTHGLTYLRSPMVRKSSAVKSKFTQP